MWLCLHFFQNEAVWQYSSHLFSDRLWPSKPWGCSLTCPCPHGRVRRTGRHTLSEPYPSPFFFFSIFFIMASCQASALGRESWTRSGHALCKQPWEGSGRCQQLTSVCLWAAELSFTDLDALIIFSASLSVPGLGQERDQTWADPFSRFCGDNSRWLESGKGELDMARATASSGVSEGPPGQTLHQGPGETELLFPALSQGRWGTPRGDGGPLTPCTAEGMWPRMPGGWEGGRGAPRRGGKMRQAGIEGLTTCGGP